MIISINQYMHKWALAPYPTHDRDVHFHTNLQYCALEVSICIFHES